MGDLTCFCFIPIILGYQETLMATRFTSDVSASATRQTTMLPVGLFSLVCMCASFEILHRAISYEGICCPFLSISGPFKKTVQKRHGGGRTEVLVHLSSMGKPTGDRNRWPHVPGSSTYIRLATADVMQHIYTQISVLSHLQIVFFQLRLLPLLRRVLFS